MSSQLQILGHIKLTDVYASSAFKVVLAIHIMAVVIAFGVTFAYPVLTWIGRRHGPQSLPLLHRIEYTTQRWLVNPGLLLVVAAGIYLASDAHLWKSFFVQWGIGAAIVIGGLVGALMIPMAKRAEELAERDIEGGLNPLGDEYAAVARRLTLVGAGTSLLVLVTILFMAIRP